MNFNKSFVLAFYFYFHQLFSTDTKVFKKTTKKSWKKNLKRPKLPKWPKQRNLCSKMWLIDQLYTKLGVRFCLHDSCWLRWILMFVWTLIRLSFLKQNQIIFLITHTNEIKIIIGKVMHKANWKSWIIPFITFYRTIRSTLIQLMPWKNW